MKTAEEIIKEAHKLKYNYKYSDEWLLDIVRITKEEYKDQFQPKWISVEEKTPPSGQCVLLYSVKSGVAEGAWLEDKGHFEQWRWSAIMTNVTHWMSLPPAPGE